MAQLVCRNSAIAEWLISLCVCMYVYIYIYVCLYLYYIDIYVHNIYVYTYYLYLNIDQWFHTIRSILSPLKWVWYYLVFDLFPPQVTECSWMPINWPVSSLEWCHRWWMEPESETNMPKTSRVDLTYMHWKLNMVPGKWWFGNWTWPFFVVFAVPPSFLVANMTMVGYVGSPEMNS